MRFRVDTKYGYVSFDESEKERALELFEEEGIRIRRCDDLDDEGVVIMGPPIVEDLTIELWKAN